MTNSNRPILPNRLARRYFLDRHALCEPPTGPSKGADLLALIRRLGFVQLDSVNTVERAHHMILHARRQCYRPSHLKPLLEQERCLFEHWTHDAAIIPTEHYPHWRFWCDREVDRLQDRWNAWRRNGFEAKFDQVLAQIAEQGPVCSRDVGGDEVKKSGWWDWHPSKTALEYLWRTGVLSVAKRQGFQKHYDLTENVIAACYLGDRPDPAASIDWACTTALDRLGFATSGEIAAFWGKVTAAEAKDWCLSMLSDGRLIEVDVESADGSAPRRSFARPDIFEAAAAALAPPGSIRVLSPFDPALRDRKRTQRLFDFHFRIEIFVPAPKRRYGYYVFPLLEGDRLTGRIDMKRQNASGCLHVSGFWPETDVRLSKARLSRLTTALERTARFSGCDQLTYDANWIRQPQTA